jgi:hypothetical protein
MGIRGHDNIGGLPDEVLDATGSEEGALPCHTSAGDEEEGEGN